MASKTCSRPGCDQPGKSQCSACGEVTYCSKECQKQHWPTHKLTCQKVQLESLKSFEDLSIKQLKTIFTNKVHKAHKKKEDKLLRKMDKMVEKPELIKFISEFVELSEVPALLVTPKPEEKYAHLANKYKSKSIKFDGQQAKPSASQMKEQANMMRSNPDLVRKANPAFANYSDQQIRQLADELDQVRNRHSLHSPHAGQR